MQKFTYLGKYLLELSFLALLIRFIINGAEIGTSLAFISVVVSMAYNKWLEKDKISQYESIIEQMTKDRNEFSERIDLAFAKIGNLSIDNSIRSVVTSEKSQRLQTPSTKRLF